MEHPQKLRPYLDLHYPENKQLKQEKTKNEPLQKIRWSKQESLVLKNEINDDTSNLFKAARNISGDGLPFFTSGSSPMTT